ncbi:ArsC family reductase [Nitrincola tapanii]|uniref:ArsC family reductase n=1 Tax=Nitrincola tapanii TaxID=1708751 RepID=A0A5A9W1P2_9GAMM|nr:ArsC family reductase [Nitrincola tapanii]KAA0874710.1 ArsC family reductase [Nitrincola tapanii]
MLKLFGISNCDTVRKAHKWLDAEQLDYHFHDFRKDGLTQEQIQSWLEYVSLEQILNKRGTTWRQLPDADKALSDAQALIQLILTHPTLIKRPVLETPKGCLIGFNELNYTEFLHGADNE